jgi:uncharacterized protein (DUF1015 family)
MHIKPFEAVFPKLEYITAVDSFFDSIKEEYNEYHDSGFFSTFSRKAFYIYRIEKEGTISTGLIACSDIQDFHEGLIKKHENTIASKEQKQMQLILKRKAAVKPVLLMYRDIRELQEYLDAFSNKHEPFLKIDFDSDKSTHYIWSVENYKSVEYIQRQFEELVPCTYIADGHHRTSTLSLMSQRHIHTENTEKVDQLLCAYFPTSNIQIQSFNRVVNGFGGLSPTAFMARIAQCFEIEILDSPSLPTAKHELTMLVMEEWYRLRWKKKIIEQYSDNGIVFDAALLDEKVLKKMLGIKDVRTDSRIRYIEGPRGLKGVMKQVKKDVNNIAFCLHPIPLEEVIKLADEGKVLPPKSTWFEPRMKNGIIIQEL